jgi:hypothetical protein
MYSFGSIKFFQFLRKILIFWGHFPYYPMAILLDKIKTDKAPSKTWFLSNGSVVGEKNNFSNCDNNHFGFHKKKSQRDISTM